MKKLGRRLDQSKIANDLTGIDQTAETVQSPPYCIPIGCIQSKPVQFDPDPTIAEIEFGQDHFEVDGRVRLLAVPPDPDIVIKGIVARHYQIRPTGKQHHRGGRVCADHSTLKEDIATAVKAGQVIMAFLAEHQDGVEICLPHCKTSGGQAAGILCFLKSQRLFHFNPRAPGRRHRYPMTG